MNLQLQKARLIRLCEGRPLELYFTSGTDKIYLQVFSDILTKQCTIEFTEENADLNDDELFNRILNPMINNLDAASYPERHERLVDAINEEIKLKMENQNV